MFVFVFPNQFFAQYSNKLFCLVFYCVFINKYEVVHDSSGRKLIIKKKKGKDGAYATLFKGVLIWYFTDSNYSETDFNFLFNHFGRKK